MDEQHFDKLGEAELRHLEDQLSDLDPDDCEVSSSGGVLSLALRDGSKIVINTHRAAREIWMAAQTSDRRAWHFAWDEASARWRVGGDELRATVSRLLSERLGRPLPIV